MMASGVSFFEPRYQFRMASGLFDDIGELIYPDVDFR